jgi:DNA-binding NarL/FixJ family response regulator
MSGVESIRVLLTDDHTLFREGIASILEREPDLRVVGQASNGQEAMEMASQLNPDVILMDIQMPVCTGLEAAQQLLEKHPGLKIIMLTVSDKDHDLFAAIKAGAQGYLLKGSTRAQELVDVVKRVAAGDAIITPALVPQLLLEFAAMKHSGEGNAAPPPSDPAPAPASDDLSHTLSDRELEVLQLVSQGLKNREIAESLVISKNTVRSHLRNILDKLHVQNRLQAANLIKRSS